MKIKLSVILIMVCMGLAGCEKDNESNSNVPAPSTETQIDIIYSSSGIPLSEAEQGRPVRLVLELKNISNETLVLNFSSGQQYDFEVRDTDDQIVWQWSYDFSFTQMFTTLVLEGQEQVKFTPIWDQTNNAGNPVPVGTYSVSGMITTTGPEFPQTQEKTLTINPN